MIKFGYVSLDGLKSLSLFFMAGEGSACLGFNLFLSNSFSRVDRSDWFLAALSSTVPPEKKIQQFLRCSLYVIHPLQYQFIRLGWLWDGLVLR